jgi:hypothetical protein
MVHKRLYLVDVIEDIVVLVHFDGEELAPREQNVEQTFGFIVVTQFLHDSASFVHLLMCTNSLSTNSWQIWQSPSCIVARTFFLLCCSWWRVVATLNLPRSPKDLWWTMPSPV